MCSIILEAFLQPVDPFEQRFQDVCFRASLFGDGVFTFN
jgi:hypothetical protein